MGKLLQGAVVKVVVRLFCENQMIDIKFTPNGWYLLILHCQYYLGFLFSGLPVIFVSLLHLFWHRQANLNNLYKCLSERCGLRIS